ncbi:ABC transporter permease [Rhodococcus sp. NPDC058505]|uniref:ABC transporter permease n=1 Tax=unclassified Rhodococcus (in: high G+C Gram-positive bacteria) TaxID=192944 RepID=UPI00364B58B1
MTEHVQPLSEEVELVDPAAEAARERKMRIARYVGMLIFPFLMVTMLVGGYLGAMHAPTPHDLPVAVVGASPADSARLADALDATDPSALAARVADDVDQARALVTDREVVGAVVFSGTGEATVLTAGAAGASQASTVTNLLVPFAAEQGATVQTDDLAPLPAHDGAGLAVMFMTTALALAGYMPLSLILSAAPELLRKRRIFPLLAGWAALVAAVVWVVADPLLGAVQGHTAAVLGICWLGVFAISAVQLFLTRIFGPLAVLVGMLFLMVLGIPASNLGMSVHTMPGMFSVLYTFLPSPAIGEALRSALYFGGTGLTGHLVVLTVGAVAAIALTVVVDVLRRRRNPETAPPEVTIASFTGGRPQSRRVRYATIVLFPLAMVVMMLSIMTSAMYQPSPRELPVAVAAADPVEAERMAAGLDGSMAGMFDVRIAAPDEAEQLVVDRTVVGAFVLPSVDSPTATLITAGAAGMSQQQVVTTVFTQVAQQQGMALTTADVTPLSADDTVGTVSMYLAIGWMMSGFMLIIVMSTAAPELLTLRRLLPIAAGWAVAMSAVVWLIAGPVVGAVSGHAGQLIGVGALATFAISLFTTVFARLIGMLAVLPVILVVMFLGVPASGGGMSIYLSPEIFRTLHDILPMPAAVESARSILYFGGGGVGGHLVTFLVWAAVALVCVLGIEWFTDRRQGTPPAEPVTEEKVAALV